jgi:hypothetical protein
MIKVLLTAFLVFSVLCTYDPVFGENLCRLTVASYCNISKVSDWSCRPCTNSPIKMANIHAFHNSTGDVLGFIGKSQSPSGICIFLF